MVRSGQSVSAGPRGFTMMPSKPGAWSAARTSWCQTCGGSTVIVRPSPREVRDARPSAGPRRVRCRRLVPPTRPSPGPALPGEGRRTGTTVCGRPRRSGPARVPDGADRTGTVRKARPSPQGRVRARPRLSGHPGSLVEYRARRAPAAPRRRRSRPDEEDDDHHADGYAVTDRPEQHEGQHDQSAAERESAVREGVPPPEAGRSASISGTRRPVCSASRRFSSRATRSPNPCRPASGRHQEEDRHRGQHGEEQAAPHQASRRADDAGRGGHARRR